MVLILTGPPAAGKTTLGPRIAAQLSHCAVVDVDVVRAMIVQPHIAPWRGEAGMLQLALGARNACDLARNFVRSGFHVVVLDVLTDETAHLYRSSLTEIEHTIVLLLPGLEVSLQRNRARGQWLADDEVRLLYEWERQLSAYDMKFDNSHDPVEEMARKLKVAVFG